MKPHMTVQRGYIFEFAVTQVAFYWLDVADSRGIGRRVAARSAPRSAPRPARTRTTRSFLTALLCL